MNLKSTIQKRFAGYHTDEYLIIAALCSIFFPFYITAVCIVGTLIYLCIKKRVTSLIKETPRAWFAIIFCVFTTVTAVCFRNWLGVICGLGLLAVFLYLFFYRSVIRKPLFELLIDICIVCSIFCAFYAVIEYITICRRLDYSILSFKVANSPKNRIHATFFNANYYAMMLEFIILMCVYRITQIKQLYHAWFYIVVALLNMVILYLTGCRTAWIPFLVTIPWMFLLNKRYGYLGLTFTGMAGGMMLLILKPALFQRITLAEDFAKRTKIWSTAIKGIQEHPLTGEGPLTYNQIYPLYDGHPTQHAHNVFLDPLLSHGIIGVLLIGVYLGSNLKEVFRLWQRRYDIPLFSLIVACILTVLIHGLLDYTVFWVQTGVLFLFILSASSIYRHQSI